jgi:hypothetical protein
MVSGENPEQALTVGRMKHPARHNPPIEAAGAPLRGMRQNLGSV